MSGPAQETPFARIIEEHLELKRRNSQLDRNMPLDRYRVEDPFRNHPLFKTEEQARIEDTLGGRKSEFGATGARCSRGRARKASRK